MSAFIKQIIKLSGKNKDGNIIEYGIWILLDEVLTTFVILMIGLWSGHIHETIVYLVCTVLGNSTMGGITVIRESVVCL